MTRWLLPGVLATVMGSGNQAYALTCPDEVTRRAGECALARGLDKAGACRIEAEAAGCMAVAGVDEPAGPCIEARANIDWIFKDRRASRTYGQARQSGLPAFDAAIRSQAHNPAAQAALRACRAWAEKHLRRIHEAPADDQVHRLSQADCQCVSVTPAGANNLNRGPMFWLHNSCKELTISAKFIDSANSTLFAWVDAGSLSAMSGREIVAPNFKVVSIAAIQISNAHSSVSCTY